VTAPRDDAADPPSPPRGTPPSTTPAPVNPGTLCIACSYDLAGLDPRAICPECGTAIQRSLDARMSSAGQLAHVPPSVAKWLRRGLLWAAVGNCMWLVALLVLALDAAGARLPSELVALNAYTRSFLLTAVMVSTIGWIIILRAETVARGAFVPARSASSGNAWLGMRVVCSACWIAFVLAFREGTTAPAERFLVFFAGFVGFMATIILVPSQYLTVRTRRARQLRKPDRPGFAAGCLVPAGVIVFVAYVNELVPGLAIAAAILVPLALIALLLSTFRLLRPHLTPHPPAQAPRHTS
jgi:hypothetical protein